MRKILILFADIYTRGGIQEYNRHLCDALEGEFPHDNFFALSLYGTKKDKFKEWRNIEIRFCDLIDAPIAHKIIFIVKTIWAAISIKPDYVICAHVNLSSFGLLLKNVFGLKYVVLTHGVDVWDIRGGPRFRGLKNADLITTVSRYTRQRMIDNTIQGEKIKILQNAVDTALFYPKPKGQKLSEDLGLRGKRALLTVGRVSFGDRYKGHDIMLSVLQKLDDTYRWLVVGDGDDLSRIKQLAEKAGVADKIRFVGRLSVDKLVDYYNLCDVFVMPSKGEGFGRVFLEAMACGKPVIAGNRDGSTEPLMDGKLGFLVDPESAEDIASAIQTAYITKEKRTDPAYLREQVAKYFSIPVFAKTVRSIFASELA